MTVSILDFITLMVVMAAFFLLINVRFLKLPSTIGLMILALSLSLIIIFGEIVFSSLKDMSSHMMEQYSFSDILFKVMLSFLLFAGALDMDLQTLGKEKWTILILATFGVIVSTFIVGISIFYVLPLIGMELDFIYCLLFGALISPTDPIAVLAMIKKTKVAKSLESQIAGESLFNDGIGVVVFLTIMGIAFSPEPNITPGEVAMLFGEEVIGGILLGSLFGYIGLKLLLVIDNEHTEIEVLVTLSMVLGGASVADMLHVSSPLAMVVMGLFVGNKGRSKNLEEAAGEYVYKFWHLMDESMNAILFILIGLQIIQITWEIDFFIASAIAIMVVLSARFISVGLPITVLRLTKKFPKYTIRILTWSGLRGGISVALALSLYDQAKVFPVADGVIDLIVVMTYCVVLFSIVVQGLTIGKVFAMANNADDPGTPAPQEIDETGSSESTGSTES